MTKTLRYLGIVSLVLAGTVMMGCSRENQPEDSSGNVVIRTTTISLDDGEAPTRALTEHGVKTLAAGDQIAVVYQKTSGSYSKVVKTLSTGDIAAGGKSARITVSLTDPKPNGNVKYVYPAALVRDNGNENLDALYGEQDGTFDKIANNFDYAKFEGQLSGTELPTATLANQLAICKFNIKNAGGLDITSSITRLTIKNGTDVYFINPSSLSSIWVALKPISSGNIDIYAAKGWALHRKTVTGNVTLAANTITPIRVTATMVEGALSGLFSVNNNHDLVYFSWGNLQAWWDGSSWNNWEFAEYQHEFIKNYQGNVSLNDPTYGDRIDLFGWSSTNNDNYYGINSSEDDDDYGGDFYDWGNLSIMNGGGNGKWRTPSESELRYILFHRPSGSTVCGEPYARYMRVHFPADSEGKIHVAGIVLFPDHFILPDLQKTEIYTHYINNWDTPGVTLDWDDWAEMEKAGAVFLPAAGYRDGNTVTLEQYGYPDGNYWTSSIGSGEEAKYYAYSLLFGKDVDGYENYYYLLNFYEYSRSMGFSVRLIGPR